MTQSKKRDRGSSALRMTEDVNSSPDSRTELTSSLNILEETIKEWRSTDFIWGHFDCMMSVFNYGIEKTGIDGGAERRGTYNDEKSADQVLEEIGGVCAGLAKGMGIIGAKVIQHPLPGDVVCLQVGKHEVSGLKTKYGAAFRLQKGVIEIDDSFLKIKMAWRI